MGSTSGRKITRYCGCHSNAAHRAYCGSIVLQDVSRATRGSRLAYALRYSDERSVFFHIVNRFLFFASKTAAAAVCIIVSVISTITVTHITRSNAGMPD